MSKLDSSVSVFLAEARSCRFDSSSIVLNLLRSFLFKRSPSLRPGCGPTGPLEARSRKPGNGRPGLVKARTPRASRRPTAATRPDPLLRARVGHASRNGRRQVRTRVRRAALDARRPAARWTACSIVSRRAPRPGRAARPAHQAQARLRRDQRGAGATAHGAEVPGRGHPALRLRPGREDQGRDGGLPDRRAPARRATPCWPWPARDDRSPRHAVMRIRIGDEDGGDQIRVDALGPAAASSRSQVVERLIHTAMEIGAQGYEGHPVGTILVIGDSTAVMEKSRQLTLNPFQGMSEVGAQRASTRPSATPSRPSPCSTAPSSSARTGWCSPPAATSRSVSQGREAAHGARAPATPPRPR